MKETAVRYERRRVPSPSRVYMEEGVYTNQAGVEGQRQPA